MSLVLVRSVTKYLESRQSLVPGLLRLYSARTQRIFPQHGAARIDDRDSCFYDRPHALLVLSLYSGRVQHRCPSSAQCEMLMKAMRYYHDHTCVRFKEWTGEPNRIDIYFNPDDGACWSMVGRSSLAVQKLSLGYRCWYLGIVLHEIGHTIGFWHEMTRFDRDKYIRVLWENIQNRGKLRLNERASVDVIRGCLGPFGEQREAIHSLANSCRYIKERKCELVLHCLQALNHLHHSCQLFQAYLTHVTELKYDPENSIELWQTNTNIENWTYVELSIYTPYSFKVHTSPKEILGL
uniref:Metalloendopeptidase n=1 Tax=Timema douglasi TaxID=61478 RepID=A0A7R8ZC42_TIMDO|nr:unnamed protein product [Timema douglasi]